jgi:glycosyltransferase involved in cell wall biosynthesis
MRTLRVCLSLGRVKRIEEGLGNFFVGLGKALIAETKRRAPELTVEWHVHARRHLHGCLGNGVVYHHASRLHRLVNPIASEFDVWHVLHQLNTLRPAWRSRRVLQTVQDLNFLYDSDQSRTPHQLAKVGALCHRADAIVCISRHTANDVIRTLAPAEVPKVIHIGVDDLTHTVQSPIAALVGKPFFFHLSRMTPNKNPQCLIETAKIWPEKRFVFAGPNTREARALATENAALPNVIFLGEVSEAQKAWLYANCEAFLFPSLAEGFGLPPLEAMQFGKPVFVANRTSLPEICPNEYGLLHSFDAPSIKLKIASSPLIQRANEYVADAKNHARTFSWEKCGRAYLDLYMELAQ